jgi:hypothetical protein
VGSSIFQAAALSLPPRPAGSRAVVPHGQPHGSGESGSYTGGVVRPPVCSLRRLKETQIKELSVTRGVNMRAWPLHTGGPRGCMQACSMHGLVRTSDKGFDSGNITETHIIFPRHQREPTRHEHNEIACISLFAWLISHQPTVLFSHNKSATSNQPAVLFSQNKPAPAISH